DLPLFRLPAFAGGNLTAGTVAIGEFGLLFVLPLYLVNVQALSTLQAGLVLAPMAGGAFGSGAAARHLAAAVGAPGAVLVGLGLAGLALGVLAALLGPHTSIPLLVVVTVVDSLGLRLAPAPRTPPLPAPRPSSPRPCSLRCRRSSRGRARPRSPPCASWAPRSAPRYRVRCSPPASPPAVTRSPARPPGTVRRWPTRRARYCRSCGRSTPRPAPSTSWSRSSPTVPASPSRSRPGSCCWGSSAPSRCAGPPARERQRGAMTGSQAPAPTIAP